MAVSQVIRWILVFWLTLTVSSHLIGSEGGRGSHGLAARDEIAPRTPESSRLEGELPVRDTSEALFPVLKNGKRTIQTRGKVEDRVGGITLEKERKRGLLSSDEIDIPKKSLRKRSTVISYEPGSVSASCPTLGQVATPIEIRCELDRDARTIAVVRTSKCKFRMRITKTYY